MINVEIFTGRECHLCDRAKAILTEVRAEIPFVLTETLLTETHPLYPAYRYKIPVIHVNGIPVFEAKIESSSLKHLLHSLSGS